MEGSTAPPPCRCTGRQSAEGNEACGPRRWVGMALMEDGLNQMADATCHQDMPRHLWKTSRAEGHGVCEVRWVPRGGSSPSSSCRHRRGKELAGSQKPGCFPSPVRSGGCQESAALGTSAEGCSERCQHPRSDTGRFLGPRTVSKCSPKIWVRSRVSFCRVPAPRELPGPLGEGMLGWG